MAAENYQKKELLSLMSTGANKRTSFSQARQQNGEAGAKLTRSLC